MLAAGIDIGSRTTAVVILSEAGEVLSYSLIFTTPDPVETAKKALREATEKIALSLNDLNFVVATGYGRIIVPFAHRRVTEITCHAKGAKWYLPSARVILDMGGQDCKVIRINDKGNVVNFAINDKCAAGTGKFLEVMAQELEIPLEEIGVLSLKSLRQPTVSSTCTVFARSEIASLLRRGWQKADILSGLHEAISVRVFNLIKKVGIEKDFVISGGIAKNIGVVTKLEEKIGLKAFIPQEPQIVGALGAALIARTFVRKQV